MTVSSLASARGNGHLLSQYLLSCPVCALSGAAHVDERADGSAPVLVRFVCPEGCAVDAEALLSRIMLPTSGTEHPQTAALAG